MRFLKRLQNLANQSDPGLYQMLTSVKDPVEKIAQKAGSAARSFVDDKELVAKGLEAGKQAGKRVLQAARNTPAGQRVAETVRQQQAISIDRGLKNKSPLVQTQPLPGAQNPLPKRLTPLTEEGIPKWAIGTGIAAGGLGLGGGAFYLANRKRRYSEQ